MSMQKTSVPKLKLEVTPIVRSAEGISAERSIVLRYCERVGLAESHLLSQTSIQEGVRTFPLLTHRDVEIHILDETSLMHTNSFKAIDGAVTAARCLAMGLDKVVVESGGNTGSALTSYCSKVGIKAYCFVPERNLPNIDHSVFSHRNAHLIAVKDRHQVKQVAGRFSRSHDLYRVPNLDWRFDAAKFRGHYLIELFQELFPFDVFAQSISAAFGPIGIYRTLAAELPQGRLPRFLGVQQEENCPMFRSWNSARGRELPPVSADVSLLIDTMYDRNPETYGTWEDLSALLTRTGGDLTTVNRGEFEAMLEREFEGARISERLADCGLVLTQRDGELVEKAGMVAITGLIKQIDAGAVEAGSRVLCSVSGGTRKIDAISQPLAFIDSPEEVDRVSPRSLSRD